jgi:hypothetical protein
MVSLTSLWLPVLLSAVLVFLASSILHMVLPWHRKDYTRLPNEEALLDALRSAGVGRGDYVFPCPENPADMRSPEMKQKYERGPMGFMTVMPSGPPRMGASLVQWFIYSIVVGVLVAYVGGLTLTPGTDYRTVFRVTSTIAFVGYAVALWQTSIWWGRSWGTTFRSTVDGLIYALLSAGVFGWLWPSAV